MKRERNNGSLTNIDLLQLSLDEPEVWASLVLVFLMLFGMRRRVGLVYSALLRAPPPTNGSAARLPPSLDPTPKTRLSISENPCAMFLLISPRESHNNIRPIHPGNIYQITPNAALLYIPSRRPASSPSLPPLVVPTRQPHQERVTAP